MRQGMFLHVALIAAARAETYPSHAVSIVGPVRSGRDHRNASRCRIRTRGSFR